jgi:hypothetical protein
VAAPVAEADTAVVETIGVRQPRTTCTVQTLALSAIGSAPAFARIDSADPAPLFTRYDARGCSAKTGPDRNAAARTLDTTRPAYLPPADLKPPASAEVTVTIDGSGDIVNAAVSSSSSPLLNQSALDSAFLATYAPAVVDCQPIGGTYRFIVRYG